MGVPEGIFGLLSPADNPKPPKSGAKDVDNQLNTDCDEGNNRYIVMTLTKIVNGEQTAKKATVAKAVATLKKNRVTCPELNGILDGMAYFVAFVVVVVCFCFCFY
jgi:hypothetical protein